jgi:hypothetical protein
LNLEAPLQLDRVDPALLHESAGGDHRIAGSHLVAQKGHVAHDQGALATAHDPPAMEHHLAQRDRNRGLFAVHDVGHRVAHQNAIDARLVDERGLAGVVRGAHRDGLARLPHGEKRTSCDAVHHSARLYENRGHRGRRQTLSQADFLL